MSALRDLSLVVVDSDTHALGVCETLLKSLGIDRVRLFTDPNEALAAIREHPPALVLTALETRPINGFKLAEMIRAEKEPAVGFVPILAMAGQTRPELVQHAKRIGIDDYLVKPLSTRVLSQRFTAVLQRRDMAALAALEHGARSAAPMGTGPGMPTGPRVREKFGFANGEAVLASLRRRFADNLVEEVETLRTIHVEVEAGVLAGKPVADALVRLRQRSEDLRGLGPDLGYPLIGEFGGQLSELATEREALTEQELRLSLALIDAMAVVAKSRIDGDGGAIGLALIDTVSRTMARLRAEAT